MNPIEIPGATVGPRSQPTEEDGATLEYLQMPRAMATQEPPRLPDAEDLAGLTHGMALLRRLNRVLGDYRVERRPELLDLSALDSANLAIIDQTLGEGEVSVLFSGPEVIRVQETRLAGVWRVRSLGPHGLPERDHIEVADIPGIVRSCAFRGAKVRLAIGDSMPEGPRGVLPVLAELTDRVARWKQGDEPYVVNFTLLPQTEQDLAYLDAALGLGPVTMLSRGYGNCRVTATSLRNVWWVQYFNSDERLILNTLEVVDVPASVLAAQEDIDDSSSRLAEMLEALA